MLSNTTILHPGPPSYYVDLLQLALLFTLVAWISLQFLQEGPWASWTRWTLRTNHTLCTFLTLVALVANISLRFFVMYLVLPLFLSAPLVLVLPWVRA